MNSFLTKHWKKHCDEVYSKEQYKQDLYAHNGRPPKFCKTCGKQTFIPKGEGEYMEYCCRECYLSTLKGEGNPMWKGGQVVTECYNCGTEVLRFPSGLNKKYVFCSSSCSMKFYLSAENQEASGMRIGRRSISSKKEDQLYSCLLELYPDCIHTYFLGYYSFDMFILSLNLLIEFDGNYWHSLPRGIKLDKCKNSYIKNNHQSLRLLRIKEKDWDRAKDKSLWLFLIINDFLSYNSISTT